MNNQWTYTLGFRNLDGSAGKSQQTMWRFYRVKPMKSSIFPQHEISMIIVIIMDHLVKPSIKPNIKPSPGGCPWSPENLH